MNTLLAVKIIMYTTDSFTVIAAFARTNRYFYNIYRKNIAMFLRRHNLLDAKTICRYDLVDEWADIAGIFDPTKYAIKFGAVKILSHQECNYNITKAATYMFRYDRYELKNYIDKNNIFYIIGEKYRNGTLHKFYNQNFIKLATEWPTAVGRIVMYAFEFSRIVDIRMFIKYNYLDHHRALKGIIANKNKKNVVKLLTYIDPQNIRKNYRHDAIKAGATEVVEWFDKHYERLCDCGCCSEFNMVMLARKYKPLKCIKTEGHIDNMYRFGDAKAYLHLKKNNYSPSKGLVKSFWSSHNIYFIYPGLELRINSTRDKIIELLKKNIISIDLLSIKYICEQFELTAEEYNLLISKVGYNLKKKKYLSNLLSIKSIY